MSFEPREFHFVDGLQAWLVVTGVLVLGFALAALILSLIFKGSKGPAAVGRQIKSGAREIFSMSFRRIGALALLTFREAVRRKVLLIFVLFAVLFMFAGWFSPETIDRPDLDIKVNISFVLTAIAWITLPVVLLLSCWGIPEDIRARSLHTVVTKPVRRIEIVVGRILGFVGIATLILLVMGFVGYIWTVRQVPESAQDRLVCRVPVYGELSYRDREGNTEDEYGQEVQGINVGDIWEYRSYIEGGTRSRAVWEFENVEPGRVTIDEDSPLILESRFEAFRTHKGDMSRPLLAQYYFVNEEKDLSVPLNPAFAVNEFGENVVEVPRLLQYYDDEAGEYREVNLYEDLATDDGTLRVEVACLDAGQYLGMARPDMFIRTPDRPFWIGYSKAVFGIWLMACLIISIGVTSSCFVKGPVATVLTASLLFIGLGMREFMEGVLTGEVKGGGPVESIVRLGMQLNQTIPLEHSMNATVISIIEGIDTVILNALYIAQPVIPDFRTFSMKSYVANGFDVSWGAAVLPSIAVTVAFFVPCVLIGYYSLRLRELEAK